MLTLEQIPEANKLMLNNVCVSESCQANNDSLCNPNNVSHSLPQFVSFPLLHSYEGIWWNVAEAVTRVRMTPWSGKCRCCLTNNSCGSKEQSELCVQPLQSFQFIFKSNWQLLYLSIWGLNRQYLLSAPLSLCQRADPGSDPQVHEEKRLQQNL